MRAHARAWRKPLPATTYPCQRFENGAIADVMSSQTMEVGPILITKNALSAGDVRLALPKEVKTVNTVCFVYMIDLSASQQGRWREKG